MTLADQPCAACRANSPTLTEAEWQQLAPEIADWQWWDEGGVPRLRRQIRFKDFAAAFAYLTQVAQLAETHGHHPELRCGWGFVEIQWWTHKIGGIHHTDAVMAAKCDQLLAMAPGRQS